ncbi:lysophospholipase [Affinibrenneria salicis]|uniref:Lysophospholipase n=1 Tax=Affinibrenneria salicis TaxID=2590031 RepID=A0A5J5FS19_9GAMM|nr:alpha/beta fold hydrolase [Affinibrenneria salicis]KAA8996120.1 lysophospholipase [Affinibrenneria salicis]
MFGKRNIAGILSLLIFLSAHSISAAETPLSLSEKQHEEQQCLTETGNIISWLKSDSGSIDRSGWSASLNQALSNEKLDSVKAMLSNYGKLTRSDKIQSMGGAHRFSTRIHYQKSDVLLFSLCDSRGDLSGFRIIPAQESDKKTMSPDFRIKDVIIPGEKGAPPLNATVLLPSQKIRAVSVLIPGSGATDRNETQGEVAPFLDLANGLASAGIASVRFDKRTLSSPGSFIGKAYAPEDEVIDDAVTAARYIASEQGVDGAPLLLIGHSQGGVFIARIASRLKNDVSGLILLATPADADIALRAVRQLHTLQRAFPANHAKYEAQIEALNGQINNWQAHKTQGIDTPPYPFHLPASYLASLETINPTDEVRRLGLPTLVMQGGQDYKVLEEDYHRWQQALSPLGERARFKFYPALDHNFMNIKQRAEHPQFSDVVIKDIIEWVRAVPKKQPTLS